MRVMFLVQDSRSIVQPLFESVWYARRKQSVALTVLPKIGHQAVSLVRPGRLYVDRTTGHAGMAQLDM
jgi:hypothetical protein